MEKGSKRCSWCGDVKPLSDFTFRRKSGKHVSYCKSCFRNYSNQRHIKRKNKLKSFNFVYKLLDKYDNILYVGKTCDLKRRINQHLNSKGHLPDDVKKQIYKIEYICLKSKIEMDIREIYYIDLYKPPYNTQYSYTNESLDITLLEVTWFTILISNMSDFNINKLEWSYDYVSLYLDNNMDYLSSSVVQLTKDHRLIEIYKNGCEASKATNINDGTIYKVVTGQRKHAGGFIWMKLLEYINLYYKSNHQLLEKISTS